MVVSKILNIKFLFKKKYNSNFDGKGSLQSPIKYWDEHPTTSV